MSAGDRQDILDRMATDLRRLDAAGCESDAMRCLLARGYRSGDIVALLDEALFEARQATVAAIVKAG